MRNIAGRTIGAALLVLLAGLVAGCATSSKETLDGSPEEEEHNLDPMLIQAGEDGEEGRIMEANEVFERGYDAYGDGRYEEAIEYYELLVENFEDSKYYVPALYNAGLSYESLEDWEKAAQCYGYIIEKHPDDDDARDALFRLAAAHHNLGEYQEVVDLMTELMLEEDLNHFDQVEAHLRRAEALLELEEWKEAEEGFRALIEANDEAEPAERLAPDSRLMVQAHYGLGRTYHERVREIPLVLPPERMGEDLEEKGELFANAHTAYIEAIRHHHPTSSPAAGYMVGKLYQDFYADIFNAEIPDDLSDEQITLYFEELRENIRPLVDRAISVYEQNLSFSRRLGTSAEENEWVAETTENLEQLQNFVEDPVTRRRAEKLVARGYKVDQPWHPQKTASGVVDVAVTDALEAAYKSDRKEQKEDPKKEPKTGPES
ncbi:MAG: tetratricopeptide repeat protein [Persicimonas sp.]